MLVTKPIASLAPLDGITDMAYRRIVRKLNPDVLLFSEFTSIDGIEHSEVVRNRLNFKKEELPYIIQLFGNKKSEACCIKYSCLSYNPGLWKS